MLLIITVKLESIVPHLQSGWPIVKMGGSCRVTYNNC